MKKVLLTLTLFLTLYTTQAQQWAYATSIGAVSGTETPAYTAKDSSGNLYVASNFDGTRMFGGGMETSAGIYDAFVTKYDANGAFVWFRKFGAAAAFVQAGGLAVDPAGNIYLAGTFTNQILVNGIGYQSAGGRDIFIVKIDSAGTSVWGKTLGGSANEEVFGISISGAKLFIAGNYSVSFTDGSVTIPTPTGQEDVLIGSYDISNGACMAMMRCGGVASDVAFAISASQHGVVVTGYFIGAAAFGSVNLTSANTGGPNPQPTPDLFVVKTDSNLVVSWAVRAGAGSTDRGNGVGQDAMGNIYVAGYFLGNVNFGNGVQLAEANGYGDGFLVKYNPSGVCQWGHKISSGVSDVAAHLSTDPLGGCYVTGAFGATCSFTGANGSTAQMVTTGSTDAFMAKWTNDGTLRWAIKAGSSSDDRGQSIVWDQNGYCQFIVHFAGVLTAGTAGTFTPPGGGSFGQLIGSYNGLTTGITTINPAIELSLYPNPVSGSEITIKTNQTNPIHRISLYTIDGKLAMEEFFDRSNSIKISVAGLKKGQYVVKIETDEGLSSQIVTVI